MMDTTINELHREKDASETLSTAQSRAPSDRPMFWTICPFCAVRYRSYRSLLNKPSRCQSCYNKFLANEAPVIGATQVGKKTTLPTMEKSALSQNHAIESNLDALTPKNQLQPQKAQSRDPSSDIPKFWTMCPFCVVRYRLYRRDFLNKPTKCQSCKMKFTALESPVQGPTPWKQSSLSSQEKRILIQKLRDLQLKHPVASNCRPSFWTMCQSCECRYHYLKVYINRWFVCHICKKDNIAMEVQVLASPGEMKVSSLQPKAVPSKNPGTCISAKKISSDLSCDVNVAKKRKRNEYGESCNTKNRSKSEDVIVNLNNDSSRRGSDDNVDAGEESGSEKQLHEVYISKETLPNAMNWNAQVGAAMGISQNYEADNKSGFCDTSSEVAVQPKISECAGPMFNDVRSDLLASTPKNQQEKTQAFSLQQQNKVLSKNPSTHFSEKESSLGLSRAVMVGEKRKRNGYGENCSTENQSKSEDAIDRAVHNNRRRFNANGDAGTREDSGWGKQLHEVVRSEDTLPKVIYTDHKLNKNQDVLGNSGNLEMDKNSGLCDSGSESAVQPKTSECIKFNDFDKLREDVNFAVGQTWALYDTADGMPRKYAYITKVSVPSFALRITYLEPDPDDEKEILWFEEDLPVSVGKFRFGKSQNTKDRSIFSHVFQHIYQYHEGSNTGYFTVSPRKGETWALFKNWDINWSSEPDSHRKFEYEIVEILSDYTDGAGVSVAFLHKAKGFVSVFFRMGTGDTDVSQILPHSLYRFSHRISSFKVTGVEGKVVPKDAYELDQAALPETIEEKIVPSHLVAEPKSKPEALYFPSKGKDFQTGQIWSFYSGNNNLPLYYCRIQRITLTQAIEQEAVFKLSVSRLKANPLPENVIQWEDKRMPVGCGSFSVRKCFEILSTDDASHQIVPQTSMDGNEYTILPKTGDVWAIYRSWNCHKDFKDMGSCSYDIVEVLDDTLDFKVLALESVLFSNEEEEKNTFFRAAESRHPDCDDEDGSEVIFTIPKLKMLRFSHQISASRVTKEIDGDLIELFEVLDSRALPTNVRFQDH